MKMICAIIVLMVILTSCGTGASNPNPTASTWDNAKWDSGKWGN